MDFLIIKIVNTAYKLISLLILIRVIMSWIRINPWQNELAGFVYKATDYILDPIRQLLDRFGLLGIIDISPVIALVLLNLIRNMIVGILI